MKLEGAYDHIDLFSGIGGFALAARWAGFETVQFVELDPFCQKVLKKNFQGVPIHDDIKTFTYATIENDGRYSRGTQGRQESESGSGAEPGAIRETTASPFLLTAGTPCQPASCAGKRRGTSDDRWLWGETFRVIAEVKPKWCILENVRGLLSLEGGLVFENLLLEMESYGYETRTFCLPACAKNAPHRRDRIWIVAYAGCIRQEKQKQQTTGSEQSDSHAPDTDRDGQAKRYHGDTIRKKNDTDTESQRLQGSIKTDRGEGPQSHDEQLHGCNREWDEPWLEVAQRFCKLDAGVSSDMDGRGVIRNKYRVQKLKALGNAIVPQIAYEIMRAIMEIENGKGKGRQ